MDSFEDGGPEEPQGFTRGLLTGALSTNAKRAHSFEIHSSLGVEEEKDQTPAAAVVKMLVNEQASGVEANTETSVQTELPERTSCEMQTDNCGEAQVVLKK